MRYEIIIRFKGEYASSALPFKSLQQVNNWLLECYDETVESADIRDKVLRSLVTWSGSAISKAHFLEEALPKPTRRKNLARYL